MDPNAMTYAAEMLLKTYLYSTTAGCTLVLMIAALRYRANSKRPDEIGM